MGKLELSDQLNFWRKLYYVVPEKFLTQKLFSSNLSVDCLTQRFLNPFLVSEVLLTQILNADFNLKIFAKSKN